MSRWTCGVNNLIWGRIIYADSFYGGKVKVDAALSENNLRGQFYGGKVKVVTALSENNLGGQFLRRESQSRRRLVRE